MNASRSFCMALALCAGLSVVACAHRQARTTPTHAPMAAGVVSTQFKAPESKVEAVKDTVHGVEIVDNYRWLEGDNSDAGHMGKTTPDVAAWTDSQDKYTRDV